MKQVNDELPDEYRMKGEITGYVRNWCRFRTYDEHCMFAEELDDEATRLAGYAVFVPKDRGICRRALWEAQRECPIGEPGSESGESVYGPDGTRTWWEGGQRYDTRGGASMPVPLSPQPSGARATQRATAPPPPNATCPTCGHVVPLLADGRRLAVHYNDGSTKTAGHKRSERCDGSHSAGTPTAT